MLKGIIINKFRGDVSLFDEGKDIMQRLTGVPVVGVIPYFRDIRVEEEDSVSLETKAATACAGAVNVAVVRLPRMSNFTDFNALEHDGRFHVYYTDEPTEIAKADVVILLELDQAQVLSSHPFATMFELFDDNLETEKADQHRLLYVALTRARHKLYILSNDQEFVA